MLRESKPQMGAGMSSGTRPDPNRKFRLTSKKPLNLNKLDVTFSSHFRSIMQFEKLFGQIDLFQTYIENTKYLLFGT